MKKMSSSMIKRKNYFTPNHQRQKKAKATPKKASHSELAKVVGQSTVDWLEKEVFPLFKSGDARHVMYHPPVPIRNRDAPALFIKKLLFGHLMSFGNTLWGISSSSALSASQQNM